MDLPDFLAKTDQGGIRIAGHRIGIEHVVELYQDGRSAEMIALDFPTLPLATIHRVLAFYLDHREAIDGYIERLDADASRRSEAMDRVRHGPTREELLARLEAGRRTGAA